MVARNEVGQHPSYRAKALLREQSPGGRVGYSTGLALAVCVLGIEAGGHADVALEGRTILAKVMPKPGQGRPVGPAEGLGVAPG